ncbi:MAG TPA: TRAP transporter small permease [Syntrophales bacterium]|nr:TRAP transporter small permease [Syntrophales bacterium]HOX94213.1 TRAP transporter small permease [Syntrophales bacterium]HPI58156.1 TRAP transporter small permease [Syntrophales bacterium]HPN25984.1 TRAP transporter small permease [Syntrophales bacterium]HQM30204.1 TRAP transporter small permease [Syntrophales bacterium]
MRRLAGWIDVAAARLNWAAAAAIVTMILLTVADVVLRLFRMPIPGTYEMVGFLGAFIIAFSLAYTASEKGHISVDVLVQLFPRRVQAFLDAFNELAGAVFFSIIACAGMGAAGDIRNSGEVSLTLELPIHPILYGIAAGCALMALILLRDFFESLKRMSK